MKTRIVAIGNSHGIRIPRPLLERTGLPGEVELSAEDEALVTRPVKKRGRAGRPAFRRWPSTATTLYSMRWRRASPTRRKVTGNGDKPLRGLLDQRGPHRVEKIKSEVEKITSGGIRSKG